MALGIFELNPHIPHILSTFRGTRQPIFYLLKGDYKCSGLGQ